MRGKPRRVFRASCRGALDGDIGKRGIKCGEFARGEIQNMSCEATDAGSGFHQHERTRSSKNLPHLRELPCQKPSKNRMYVHTGVVIAKPANARARIISV